MTSVTDPDDPSFPLLKLPGCLETIGRSMRPGTRHLPHRFGVVVSDDFRADTGVGQQTARRSCRCYPCPQCSGSGHPALPRRSPGVRDKPRQAPKIVQPLTYGAGSPVLAAHAVATAQIDNGAQTASARRLLARHPQEFPPWSPWHPARARRPRRRIRGHRDRHS